MVQAVVPGDQLINGELPCHEQIDILGHIHRRTYVPLESSDDAGGHCCSQLYQVLPLHLCGSISISGYHPLHQHVSYLIVGKTQDLFIDVIVMLTQTWRRPLYITGGL